MALINHLFADVPEDEREKMLQRMLNQDASKTRQLGCSSKNLLDALRLIEHDEDGKEFKDIQERAADDERERVIIARVGHSKQAAEMHTPSCIKDLRPQVQGVTLVWQPARTAFEGYYPKWQGQKTGDADDGNDSKKSKNSKKQSKKRENKQKFHSFSRSYGGGKWTQSTALFEVVKQLWKCHKRYGGEACLHDHEPEAKHTSLNVPPDTKDVAATPSMEQVEAALSKALHEFEAQPEKEVATEPAALQPHPASAGAPPARRRAAGGKPKETKKKKKKTAKKLKKAKNGSQSPNTSDMSISSDMPEACTSSSSSSSSSSSASSSSSPSPPKKGKMEPAAHAKPSQPSKASKTKPVPKKRKPQPLEIGEGICIRVLVFMCAAC